MDIRFKKVLAGISTGAVMLTQFGTAFAAYSDVQAGVWYEEAVEAFVDAGYLDASQPRFRGGDPANRAEFVKLIVELNGGILSTPPAVASFDDVKASAWYYGYFEEAGKEGWVRGDNNCYGSHPCNARPGSNINRAEAGALIVRAFGLDATGDAPQFVDNPSGQWYTDVMQTAADHCVLQGDDSTGRVRPGDNMNRAEMVVMLNRVDQDLTFGVDCGTGETTEPSISDATSTSATTVEVEFNVDVDEDAATDKTKYTVTSPEQTISSISMVDESTVELTLAAALEANKEYTVSVSDMETAGGDMFSDTATFKGYSALVIGEGILEVSVSSKNPISDTVPRGSNGVVMLSLDLSASCDDSVTIEDITILHEGFGDESDITGVYAAVDGARLSRKRTIDDQNQTSNLRLSTPLTIDACKSKTVDVVADFGTTATISGEHNLVVELPSDFTSNAKSVTGNFPARGNTFRVGAVTSGQVSIAYRTISPDEVDVGDEGQVVGKFEVSTNSVEDQTIYSMTLEQNGTASDSDMANIRIRRTDNTVLTNTAAGTTGDFVTLVFDPPFTVLEGDKVTLEVIADILDGAGDTIIMQFEETSDIFAVGSLYGYGVNGQLYGSQVALGTSPAADTVTIQAGEFTIEINGPTQASYTRDADDVVLANVQMSTGGEEVDIRKLYVAVEGESSTGANFDSRPTAYDAIHEALEGVELRNKRTGQTISAVRLTGSTDVGQVTSAAATPNTGTYQVYRFDDFSVVGNETYELRADLIDNGAGNTPVNGDRFKVHICGEPTRVSAAANTTGCTFGGLITSSTSYQMDIEGRSTGDKVEDVRPRGTISGNFQRVASAQLTIAVKSLGTSDTAVKNSKNVNLHRFEGRAGEAEDVLLTKVAFVTQSGSLQNGQNYTFWVDSDGDGKVDTKLQSGVSSQGSPATVTFDDLTGGGFVIPKEQTVLFEVHADISASLTNDDLMIRFNSGSTSYIEAEEVDDGSSLSNIQTNGSTCSTTCDIIVTTLNSIRYLLVNQGDLFVTLDSTPLRNRQILGGTLGEAVLRLQLHAENEAVDVTDLQINSSGSLANSIDRLELYKEGATTYFALATVGGCGNDDVLAVNTTGSAPASTRAFCANMESKQLVVPEGADVDVLVRPRLKTDVDGALSGDVVELFITPQCSSNNATGSGAVRARGNDSSNNLDANDCTDAVAEGEVFIGRATATATNAIILGNENRTVLSKITSITNASPDANGTSVPTGVASIGQFKVAAAPNNNSKDGFNDVVLSGVIFNVAATNVTMNALSFKFYNKANATITKTCQAKKASDSQYIGDAAASTAGIASGSFLVDCQKLTASGNPNTEIDPGTDATFVLEADITNNDVVGANASTLQVSIQNFDSITRTVYGTASTHSHFQWNDKDSTSIATSAGGGTSWTFLWVEYPETTVKSTSYQS